MPRSSHQLAQEPELKPIAEVATHSVEPMELEGLLNTGVAEAVALVALVAPKTAAGITTNRGYLQRKRRRRQRPTPSSCTPTASVQTPT